MRQTLDTLLIICYNITILGSTVYLIEFHDWNPWWMLLAVGLLATSRKETK